MLDTRKSWPATALGDLGRSLRISRAQAVAEMLAVPGPAPVGT